MDRFQEVKQRVKEATDVVALIEPYVTLKRRGKTLIGLCPFHQEKTPSFTVYPESQSFYCFGCSKAGDVFTFLIEREGLTFRDALERLADAAGISTEGIYGKGRDAGPRVDVTGTLQLVRDFFANCLQAAEGAPARDYLARRGLAAAIGPYGLGFHPAAAGRLVAFARENRLPLPVLEQAGLVRDARHELLHGRVIFPIEDERGRVVGFGGRVLDDSKPKYINSPESPVFHKRKVLFGLKHCKQHNERRIVVMEGYTDVIACHLAGFHGAVATLGTSLTVEHCQILSRYATDGVTLLFDGDAAGRRAAERAFHELVQSDLPVRIALLPEGVDPADQVAARVGLSAEQVEQGRAQLRAILEGAEDAMTMWFRLLRRRLDLSVDANVQRAVDEAAELLAKVQSPARHVVLLGRLAALLGLDPETMRRSIKRRRQTWQEAVPARQGPEDLPASSGRDAAGAESAARDLLACLLRDPNLVAMVPELPQLSVDVRELVQTIRALAAEELSGTPELVRRAFTACAEHPSRARLLGECLQRAQAIQDPPGALALLLSAHRAAAGRQEAQQTRIRLQEAAARGDRTLADELARQYLEQLKTR
jgi:DNA primase